MSEIKYEIAPEFSELELWICQLPSDFSRSGETIFKSRNEVKVFNVGNYVLNVKSFKIPNLINRIAYVYFRGSKAARSYHYARRFFALGIATPRAVGYVDCIDKGILKESYYISIHYNNDFTLREVLNYQVADHDVILHKWVRFTYEKLHRNNIFHLDYSPGNTLICKKDNNFEFQIVDLNRMKFGSINFERGLYNFRQLDTDLPTLGFLATEYAKLCQKDAVKAIKTLTDFDRENKEKRRRHNERKEFFRSILRFGRVTR